MLPLICFLVEVSKSNSSSRLPLRTTTRVSSGWAASMSIKRFAMDRNSEGRPRVRAIVGRRRRAKGGDAGGACGWSVEQLRGKAHGGPRRGGRTPPTGEEGGV